MNEPGSGRVRSALSVHNDDPFYSLSYHPELVKIARGLVGGNCYLHQSRINYKYGLEGTGWSWHSDFETWHAQDGMPGMRCFSAMIPLTSNTADNGALLVIPGSHSKFISCKALNEVSDYKANWTNQMDGLPSNEAISSCLKENGGKVVSVSCDVGDLVLFDCNVLHGSAANMSPNSRTNLFFVFNSLGNQLQDSFCGAPPRPEYAATRNKIKEAIR